MNWRTRAWATAHLLVVAGFLLSVAAYYHRDTGFTGLIEFGRARHDTELPRVRQVPHEEQTEAGYDGQFYAQLAVDPLLRDPAIDNALDTPRYRARRILFSWTAYALGLGRPAWILQAYALQNVIAWLILAWLLFRWFRLGTARAFLLWSACLLTHGLIASVRSALLDGPSVLLIAIAVAIAEGGETARRQGGSGLAALIRTSLVVGLAGLARETNLLASTLLLKWIGRSPRSWPIVAAAMLTSLLPLLLWLDYLHSLYLGSMFAGGQPLAAPFDALRWKWLVVESHLRHAGWRLDSTSELVVLIAFVAQGAYMLWAAASRRDGAPWLIVGLSFFALGLIGDRSVWGGTPGAITRVALPLTIGFNVIARNAPWPVLMLGNLGVAPGVATLIGLM